MAAPAPCTQALAGSGSRQAHVQPVTVYQALPNGLYFMATVAPSEMQQWLTEHLSETFCPLQPSALALSWVSCWLAMACWCYGSPSRFTTG